VAKGTSVIVENIFESRFKHIPELVRMGAKIRMEGRVAVIDGVERLYGAEVVSPDLRGGAALVLAGLCAEGITEVGNIKHVERGYEDLVQKLRSLGAAIQKVSQEDEPLKQHEESRQIG
jgi:UDP-N-acetylglucosamine 1-carboxyvinyltransferase